MLYLHGLLQGAEQERLAFKTEDFAHHRMQSGY